MKVTSTRFGQIEVGPEEVVRFNHGILGFEERREYILIRQDPESPFCFLQSVDDPDLAFVVTDPLWLRPDYKVWVRDEDLAKIEATDGDAVAIYAIVTVPKDPQEMTVNLMAPLLINSRTRLGLQHVQVDSPYQVRHRVKDELERRRRLEEQAARDGAKAEEKAGEPKGDSTREKAGRPLAGVSEQVCAQVPTQASAAQLSASPLQKVV